MGHVGLVLGIEMARLARSNKDWYQLLEVCAVLGTVLADEDAVYDSNDSNDRLLLGLKGTISEFELVTMRNRLERGKLNKAHRGELFHKVPLGYLKLATGEVILDPDEQARAVVQLLFDKFAELGTLYGLFRYLVRNKIRLGMRIQDGPQRGQLTWRRPALPTLNQVLHNPIYAGAYAYGHRPSAAGRNVSGLGRPGRSRLPMSEWKVLLHDRLPAYITWDQFLANQQRLEENRSMPGSSGSPRNGSALLTGLLVCGGCGRCLRSTYRTRGNASYSCERHLREDTDQICHGLQAAPIDELVARQILRAIEPAALELSLKAMEDVRQERDRLHRHWKQRLERARYESERMERQYQAVEPENRLVARTLEQRWEEALCQQRQLEDDYDRFLQEQPQPLREDERARIQALSGDLPALWDAPTTTLTDRKEIIRLLVERVVVHVHQNSEYVDATIHWRGGCTTSHEIVRPVVHYEQLRDYNQLMERIEQYTACRTDGGTDRGVTQRRRLPHAEITGRLHAPPREEAPGAPRSEPRQNLRRRTWAERMVAARPRARTASVGQQTAQLGGARLGRWSQNAVAGLVDPLGRRARARAITPATRPLETGHHLLPADLDHSAPKSRLETVVLLPSPALP
jgi:Recombinase/Resolvase, N terminal domain/Recombinase zinc beta ribbon domain